jgi:hypothetical protein
MSSVDWRDRWGHQWLTNIKDQGGCGSCYTFGGTGLVEAMARIEHGLWCLRSEGDVGDAISFLFGARSKCGGGSPEHVLQWIEANGIADPGCWPYADSDQLGVPTVDRLGRTVKLYAFHQVSGHNAMKDWLHLNGPLAACFNCYPEFDDACKNDSVYIYSNPENKPSDGHCILIVGYDDAKGAWLVRNSWGTGWGTLGYGWFGYGQGEHGLEYFTSYGVVGADVDPDPWSKRRVHNGNFFESGNGTYHRDFEVWSPGPGGAIRHYTQNGKTLVWTLAETLPEVSLPPAFSMKGYDCGGIPTVLGSTYFRNYEVVYPTTGAQLRHFFYDQVGEQWHSSRPFGPTDTDGVAGFIQIDIGAPGNFEVVVHRSAGVLENWWRDNVGNDGEWASRGSFGSGISLSGATLVQRWAAGGNPGVNVPAGLDLVCVTQEKKMQRWWRDDPNTMNWAPCETFGDDVDTPPVMIRSQFGATNETIPGHYELCVAVGGRIEHWWTPGNPEPSLQSYHGTTADWKRSATFGTNVPGQHVKQVLGLMQSSYGFDLEVVAELSNGKLQHFSRDGAGWHARKVFGSTV